MDPRNQPSLLERIYSWENLLDAYHEAASEKWYRNDVTAFAANLEENLISIQNDLIWHAYKVGRYRQFYVHEPKKRLVMALGFRDRVVQWAIYLQTNQHLDNGMIYHSYGCRVGKGTTRAADRLQYWCTLVDRKPGKWYYLKLDVSKYFYRVDHRVLLDILRRKFPNEDGYLWLMETIINCDHTPFGLPPGKSADEIPPSERLLNGRHRAAAGGDTMGIESVLIACLPSAITGFCFWCIEQKIQKQSKKLEKEEKQRREAQDKREKLHEQQELFLVQGVNAAIALGEATARAVQRIPDAHCNGDMHAALDYAAKVKHEQKDFLTRQGIESIYES